MARAATLHSTAPPCCRADRHQRRRRPAQPRCGGRRRGAPLGTDLSPKRVQAGPLKPHWCSISAALPISACWVPTARCWASAPAPAMPLMDGWCRHTGKSYDKAAGGLPAAKVLPSCRHAGRPYLAQQPPRAQGAIWFTPTGWAASAAACAQAAAGPWMYRRPWPKIHRRQLRPCRPAFRQGVAPDATGLRRRCA